MREAVRSLPRVYSDAIRSEAAYRRTRSAKRDEFGRLSIAREICGMLIGRIISAPTNKAIGKGVGTITDRP